MKTIINYVTMTTDITPRHILKKRNLFGYKNNDDENYLKIIFMSIIPGMMELIKVLQEKDPDNCLQILVDVLVKKGFLVDTGWKEKPDPISALLLERRESIEVIERLMEAVKGGGVNNVEQLLSQYPIPQHIQHIRRRCCCLALERRDLSLAQFLYQYDRLIIDKNKTRELITAAIHSDFTEGVEYLLSQGLPLEVKGSKYETSLSALMVSVKYNSLNVTKYILSNHVRLNINLYKNIRPLEEATSIDMLRLLLTNETIRKNTKWDDATPLYNQILRSSTQSDCMSRVQILIDAGATVKETFFCRMRKACFKIIGKRWFQVIDYLLDHLKDINSTTRYCSRNILHYTLFYSDIDVTDYDVKNNILDFVKNLVERGVNIYAKDTHGASPLMYASKAGYLDVMKYLIERGADVHLVAQNGCTALMMACEEGHKEVVEYLIQNGDVDVNMVKSYGRTALMEACREGHKNVVEFLIQHGGADVNMANTIGRTASMMACRGGRKEIVEYLIHHGGADVNMVDKDGQTALMMACRGGHKEVVEYLMQHEGADVNMVNNDGWTALMIACRGGHKEVVKYLIQHGGVDVNKANNNGRTALMEACTEGHKEVVEYLLQHEGADVNMVDKDGWTALYFCLYNIMKYIVVFKLLVESGGDLSLPSNGVKLFQKILNKKVYDLFLYVISLKPQIVDATETGDSILHLLAMVDYDFTMEHFSWLFDCSVDINHQNNKTDSPLMIAAVLQNEKYLEVFTHHPDVDLNKQNNNGHTALHCLILGFTEFIQGFRQRQAEDIAHSYYKQFYLTYMRCVDILLGAGTDVNIQDNEGKTVLMMAARENDKQLARKLLDAGAMVDKVDGSGRPALLYVDISDSVYDLTIFLLLFPSGGNHVIDLPCIHGNTFIQTVLQFPHRWQPCKVVSFVRWLVYRNCSLQLLRGGNGHSTYNDLSLDDFSISERQDLRRLLYLSGAPKEEIIATVNFQAEDEAEDTTEILHSKNREMFENVCLNVSLQSKCIRYFRQLLGTEIRAKLPGLEIPHLESLLLLEDVVGDNDDVILGEFEEVEDESDYCSYIVDKNREYYGYLNNKTKVGIKGRYCYYTLEKCRDDEDDDDENYNDYNYDDDDDDDSSGEDSDYGYSEVKDDHHHDLEEDIYYRYSGYFEDDEYSDGDDKYRWL